MTFQAYIDNIKAKQEFDLGHGHSMAIWAAWKDKGWVQAPKPKK